MGDSFDKNGVPLWHGWNTCLFHMPLPKEREECSAGELQVYFRCNDKMKPSSDIEVIPNRQIVGSVPSNPPIYSNECGGQCNVCGYDVICSWEPQMGEITISPPTPEFTVSVGSNSGMYTPDHGKTIRYLEDGKEVSELTLERDLAIRLAFNLTNVFLCEANGTEFHDCWMRYRKQIVADGQLLDKMIKPASSTPQKEKSK